MTTCRIPWSSASVVFPGTWMRRQMAGLERVRVILIWYTLSGFFVREVILESRSGQSVCQHSTVGRFGGWMGC